MKIRVRCTLLFLHSEPVALVVEDAACHSGDIGFGGPRRSTRRLADHVNERIVDTDHIATQVAPRESVRRLNFSGHQLKGMLDLA